MATESRCTIGHMNEASLLSKAKSGETAAVDLLCIAHKEKLFRTVFRITRNLQDAMQDSFLNAFSSPQELRWQINRFDLADAHGYQFSANDPSQEA
jgi:hypothetical protein